ncbi:hypothetical protein E2C01_076617 [Portunus trituberculatus]|uniref:Uncharacterized protein n=1 Tax=Portunus trituberculatus TaxID=210409 RepID=A0A5B7II79_PORTR|nr:hypothetical protein [Portunus trituberculatus]
METPSIHPPILSTLYKPPPLPFSSLQPSEPSNTKPHPLNLPQTPSLPPPTPKTDKGWR